LCRQTQKIFNKNKIYVFGLEDVLLAVSKYMSAVNRGLYAPDGDHSPLFRHKCKYVKTNLVTLCKSHIAFCVILSIHSSTGLLFTDHHSFISSL
jgi:hypothetical protein